MLLKQHLGDVLTFPQISPIWSSMRNCERESNLWFRQARKNFVRARKILKLRARRARAARGLMSSPELGKMDLKFYEKKSLKKNFWQNFSKI